jgi:hypothetical protein
LRAYPKTDKGPRLARILHSLVFLWVRRIEGGQLWFFCC